MGPPSSGLSAVPFWAHARATLSLASSPSRSFPPVVVRTPGYLPQLISMVDAIGLGAYAVVGMTLALEVGLSLPGVVLVGLVNAVGGGILRDVLIRREPNMFLPGTLEEVLALLGCLWFVLQVSALGWPLRAAAWLTIGTIFVLRLAAIRYGLRSKPLPAFRDYWEQPHKR